MNWKFTYLIHRNCICLLIYFLTAAQISTAHTSNNRQFQDISVIKQKNKITISWTVSLVQQKVYFEIERAGQDKVFKTAGILFPEENNRSSLNFSFNDNIKNIGPGIVFYYRVKQVNANGTSVYSLIKEINIATKKTTALLLKQPIHYSHIHSYSYCGEISSCKMRNNNMVAGILRLKLLNLKNNLMVTYQTV
jgi:hypothetical protein